MPIRAELRHFYRGPAWRETRTRILERARYQCEQCHKDHLALVRVVRLPMVDLYLSQFWCEREGGAWWTRCIDGVRFPATVFRRTFPLEVRLARIIRVVLTVAHLNHVSGDDRDENLLALCQWCHLNYDKLHHRETRCERKDAARPLLIGEARV